MDSQIIKQYGKLGEHYTKLNKQLRDALESPVTNQGKVVKLMNKINTMINGMRMVDTRNKVNKSQSTQY